MELRVRGRRCGTELRFLGLLQSLAELAIAEMMAPKVCRACNATGEVRHGGQQVVCQACGGVGRLPWSIRRRAKHVGMHGESWRASWDLKYRRILGLLDAVEGRELGRLGRALSCSA